MTEPFLRRVPEGWKYMRYIHLMLCAFLAASAAFAGEKPVSYSEYQKSIQGIYRDVVDLVAPSDLFGVTNFVELFEEPQRYKTNAIVFLGDKSNTDEQKMVVVYSLQRLPLDDYVKYEQELLHLAQRSKLSKTFLNRSIFPASDWNTTLEFNYEESGVRKLLRELAACDLISEDNKAYVKSVLSGEAKKDILELQDAGMLPKHQDARPGR
jgi:hypothetical protein